MQTADKGVKSTEQLGFPKDKVGAGWLSYHNDELPRKVIPGFRKYHIAGEGCVVENKREEVRWGSPVQKGSVPTCHFFVLAGFNSAAARPSRSGATLNYGNTKLAWYIGVLYSYRCGWECISIKGRRGQVTTLQLCRQFP